MQPLADGRLAVVADSAVGVRGLDRLGPASHDVPFAGPAAGSAVALGFLRALRRLRSEKEFSVACDIGTPDAARALTAICGALRRVYTLGRPGPISMEPVTPHVFQRLRQTFVEEIDPLRSVLEPGELSAALRAFDLVRAEMERDETDRFVAALRAGDAMDLVVEIAHDMRSPLTAILMLTEMVRGAVGEERGDTTARQLALVYSAAFGLNSLVNDVIALAGGTGRLTHGESVPFSISALMASVGDILRPVAEERQLDLRVTTPSVDYRLGQPIALSRVLLNLASNALQYTETGEVRISAVEVGPAEVRFEVADTGPGLPQDVLRGLFEPFRKQPAGARARRFSRTGLGFAICRKLLRDMGSELVVDSTADSGTRARFEVSLPPAPEQPLRPTRPAARLAEEAPRGG